MHNEFHLNGSRFGNVRMFTTQHFFSPNFPFMIGIFADRYVMADPFDIQGPSFTIEPPHHLEFTNIVDNHVDCVAKGSPPPKIEWLHLDNTPVTTIPRVSRMIIMDNFLKC